jgi:hypothetical protein
MVNHLRAWRIRRRPPTKSYLGVVASYVDRPTDVIAELIVQLTRCPHCAAGPVRDCSGTTGRWDFRWILRGADGHDQPRFHASRVELAQRRIDRARPDGPSVPLRSATDPPHVTQEE